MRWRMLLLQEHQEEAVSLIFRHQRHFQQQSNLEKVCCPLSIQKWSKMAALEWIVPSSKSLNPTSSSNSA